MWKGNEISILEIHLHSHVLCNSQDVESLTYMSSPRWMNKELWYLQDGRVLTRTQQYWFLDLKLPALELWKNNLLFKPKQFKKAFHYSTKLPFQYTCKRSALAFHKHFFKVFVFIYLEGRVWGAEEAKTFHLLVHSPNAGKNWGWFRLKPQAKNPIWVSHAGGWDPINWTITLQGGGSEAEAGLNTRHFNVGYRQAAVQQYPPPKMPICKQAKLPFREDVINM